MPKQGKIFRDNLSISCTSEMHEQLVALSYLRGGGGVYAVLAKDLLTRGLAEELGKLTPAEQREFEQIMGNIQAQTAITRQMREERARDKSLQDDGNFSNASR